MKSAEPPTSARFRRAALAERQQLERKRAKVDGERQRIADALHVLDLQLLALDERLEVLSRLAGSEVEEPDAPAVTNGTTPPSGEKILRGTAIRETAVELLAERPEGRGSIHYRRWYELLGEAGYAVAGKDPLAVFLTQISRSSAIKRSTEAGTYSLDHQAPDELRRRLATLDAEVRQVTNAAPEKPANLAAIRKRREALHSEIRRVERALDEAVRLLRPQGAAAAKAR